MIKSSFERQADDFSRPSAHSRRFVASKPSLRLEANPLEFTMRSRTYLFVILYLLLLPLFLVSPRHRRTCRVKLHHHRVSCPHQAHPERIRKLRKVIREQAPREAPAAKPETPKSPLESLAEPQLY